MNIKKKEMNNKNFFILNKKNLKRVQINIFFQLYDSKKNGIG